MKAVSGSVPRDARPFAVELKWDGMRTLVHVWGGRALVRSRLGRDVTSSFPEVAAIAGSLKGPAVLDGEIVAFDEAGRPSFQRLQARLGATQRAVVEQGMREVPVVFVAFDVLHLAGLDTMGLPYVERRALLDELALEGPAWTTPARFDASASELLEAARERGLEGIVLKRLDSPYVSGRRSSAWIKVKLTRRQEFVIGGWSPGAGSRGGTFGALLVGHHDERGLRYAGSVGTGFTEATLARLRERLAPLARPSSPFVDNVDKRGAVFVEPRLVAEVEFAEWTEEGRLRHPSFKGLREDVDPDRVVREERDS